MAVEKIDNDQLDDEDTKKADPDSYAKLSKYVDDARFDQLSIEYAHCCNDLSLLDKFSKKTVIFGSVAFAKSELETVEDIAEWLRAALNHIDRDRLIVAPDCGLGLLPLEIAAKKLIWWLRPQDWCSGIVQRAEYRTDPTHKSLFFISFLKNQKDIDENINKDRYNWF